MKWVIVMENNVKMTFFGGQVDELEMKSALISGRSSDSVESPMSLYCGILDLEEIHTALFYAHRAVLKILSEEFSIPMSEAESFIISAATEAIIKEYNVQNGGETDIIDTQKAIRLQRTRKEKS